MPANDGAVAIARPPTIRDRLLNMSITPVEPFHGPNMREPSTAMKPRERGLTAL
jgi:hypothetical protein